MRMQSAQSRVENSKLVSSAKKKREKKKKLRLEVGKRKTDERHKDQQIYEIRQLLLCMDFIWVLNQTDTLVIIKTVEDMRMLTAYLMILRDYG